MSSLLLKWLNEDVQLSQHVECFESDFASGYLLGEILHRSNQQHNFSDFVPSETADAKIVNFSLLEPTMRSLGIKFDAVTATNVMNQQAGVAAKLLYQIKTAVERVRRSGTISNRPHVAGGVLPIHNIPSRLPKHAYDQGQHRSFEHTIRVHVKAVEVLAQEKAAKESQTANAAAIAQAKADYIDELVATRQQRLHLTKIQREFTQSASEGETEAWTAAQAKRMEREHRKARYDNFVAQRQASKRARDEESARTQVDTGINTFEAAHPGNIDDGAPKRRGISKRMPKQISIGYGIRSLSSVYAKIDVDVPDHPLNQVLFKNGDGDTGMPAEKQLHVDLARQKRLQREVRCDLAGKRRAKFVKLCDTRQRQRSEQLDLNHLEATLLRSTTSELAVESTRRNVLTYMDVVVANREYRESKYAKRRKRDELEAITRDASAYGMIHHRYTDAVLAQNERYDRLSLAVIAATSKQHHVLCAQVLDRVLDVVHEAATYRTTSTWIAPPDEFLPDVAWDEYKAFFVHAADTEFAQWHGAAFHARLDGHEYLQHVEGTRMTAIASVASTPPDSLALSLAGAPPFSCGHLAAPHVLGEIVKYARVLTDPLPLPPPKSDLPSFSLKIVLLGKPFSGRKTLSKRLCAAYNLASLSVHSLLEAAIAQETELGRRATTLLQDGLAVPNDVYIGLLHEALVALGKVHPPVQGWVLEDFVCDVDEARDLVRLLGGVVPGELPRTLADRESLLAPGQPDPPLPSTFFQGKSGLDMVFMLPIQRTMLYRHCLGKLIDPVTHAQFHIRSNPPPEDSTVRYRLQLWSDGIIAPENLSLHAQSHDSTDADVLAWFRQYDALRHVDSKCADIASTIFDHVDHFLADAAAAKHQAERAVESAAAMALGAEEFRTRQLVTLDAAIIAAQADDAAATAAVKAAEDAKAKKDELAALKAAADAAKTAVDHAVSAATAFLAKFGRPPTVAMAPPCVAPVQSLAEYVASLWATTERTYESVLQRCFARFRRMRDLASSHCVQVVSSFCAFVRRVDARQSLVDAFQADFNAVIEDMRFDPATQAELHVRTDTLQDTLLSLIETKGAETAMELGRMLQADGWKDVLSQSVVLLGQICLQAEVDRFFASVAILVDAIQGHELGLGKLVDGDATDPSSALLPPILLVKDPHAEDEKEAKKAPKKGVAATAAVVAADAEAPPTPEHDLTVLVQKAIDVCKKLAGRFVKADEKAPDAGTPAAPAQAPTKEAKAHTSKSKADLHHDKSGGGLPPAYKETPGSVNAIRALVFELALVQARIQAIATMTEATLGKIHGGVVALEADLQQVLVSRLARERGAVQSLIVGVRHAIEMHVALPHRLVVHTTVVDRYPPHRQEREDTDVRLSKSSRIMAPPPVPPYPVVEYLDRLYLSTTQLNALVATFKDVALASTGRHDCVPRSVFVQVFTRLASTATRLPSAWHTMHLAQYMEMASYFDKNESGLIKLFPNVMQTFQAKHKVDDMLKAIKFEAGAAVDDTPAPLHDGHGFTFQRDR